MHLVLVHQQPGSWRQVLSEGGHFGERRRAALGGMVETARDDVHADLELRLAEHAMGVHEGQPRAHTTCAATSAETPTRANHPDSHAPAMAAAVAVASKGSSAWRWRSWCDSQYQVKTPTLPARTGPRVARVPARGAERGPAA